MKKYILLCTAVVTLVVYFICPECGIWLSNTFSNQVVSRGSIIKSPNDQRGYRVITLKNGLKAVLVSDPKTDKSAAAMNVLVGSYDEPADAMGIAHFLEHMLFLGTKKYPSSNEYSEFMTQHGGHNNAYTANDTTVYYFDVLKSDFDTALDMFGEFFISPLFNADMIDKEKNAVDSEFKMQLKNDGWRMYQVDKITSNANHPYHRFTIGNLETLSMESNDALRQKVIKFYNAYYSSDNMYLVVYGAETLNQLENMVVNIFSKVKKFKVAENNYVNIKINSKQDLSKQITVKSAGDEQKLSIRFPIENQQKKYMTKPAVYISNLLNRVDSGTLHAKLLEKNWINSMWTFVDVRTDHEAIFAMEFDLTNAGFDNYQTIITMMYQYLAVIKKEGIAEWRFNEIIGRQLTLPVARLL